jgi:hypothetical protein
MIGMSATVASRILKFLSFIFGLYLMNDERNYAGGPPLKRLADVAATANDMFRAKGAVSK